MTSSKKKIRSPLDFPSVHSTTVTRNRNYEELGYVQAPTKMKRRQEVWLESTSQTPGLVENEGFVGCLLGILWPWQTPFSAAPSHEAQQQQAADYAYGIYVRSVIFNIKLSIFSKLRSSSSSLGLPHARNTPLSISGCDALTCAFETMAFGSAVLSGRNSIWFWAIATIPFFGATWESFFTDTLILPEINGPTEGLLLIYSVHFFTAFVGPTWWTLNFRQAVPLLRFIPFIPDMPLNTFIIWGMMICAVVPTVGYNISNVHKVIKARGTSMVSALAMVLPFVALLTGIVTWAWLSPSDILATQPHLVLVGSGFAFGFLVGRLILAHLCDEPKGLKTSMCTALVVLPLGIANALSAKLLGGAPLVNEVVVLLGYCAYTSSLYLHFAVGVIHEITSALGIYCFRLGKKKDIKGN
ncbi:hypothetical protein AXG93_900s1070 [Marchantia polymorpha subsp. ruderalis]|uniref:Uncharacterized protein n=1 Tax=Marchantia polymorpha subsp. ruderalis TaxID=1480154 RepID=A0A176W3E3_MARPO|nr:hypothetical protein AXG93_900s1070 [Marchantia polymorpha subsp. ruderalis]